MSSQPPAPTADDDYDSLDAHLAAAGDLAHACVPMGMLLAWCVNMHLVSPAIQREHERLILRLRFQEALGSELLVACGGNLQRSMFSAEGQRFLDDFYPQYMTLFQQLFGENPYAVAETWSNYQTLAARLTGLYLGAGRQQARAAGVLEKITSWWRR
jgi:hypothetical protein